jgi:DNA replication protein DnaC
MIQTLSAAAAVGAGELKRTMQRYLKPSTLICDEVGYLPIDKLGADLLFQVVSQRYERGSIVITTNRLCGAPHNRFNAANMIMRSARGKQEGLV